jgi:chorismate dehydratase
MTRLPFVYAMWSGRDAACGAEHVAELNAARGRGEAEVGRIAADDARGDRAREQLVVRYLSDNLRYGLGDAEIAGLRHFYELAAEQGLVPGLRDLRFFEP